MAVLEKIRVKLGVLITVLIAVALLSFIVDPSTLESTVRSLSAKNNVGKINGNNISYQEFAEKLEYYKNIYALQTGQQATSEQINQQVNDATWQSFISELYTLPAIQKAGIRVCDEEIAYIMNQEEGLRQIAAQLSTGSDSNGQLETYWQYMENSVKEQQYYSKYVSLLSASIVPTKLEISREKAENNTSADIDYVSVPVGFQRDSTIVVENREVEKFYRDHKEDYKQVASRDIEFVAFEVLPSESDIELAKSALDKVFAEFASTTNIKNFLARNSDEVFDQIYYSEDEYNGLAAVRAFAFGANQPAVMEPVLDETAYISARVIDTKQMADSVFVNMIASTDAAQMDSLAAALAKGGDFAAAAAEYSAMNYPDPTLPGVIGWATQGMLPSEMAEIFSTDVKLNTIVLKKIQGASYIVKVSDRTKASAKKQIAVLKKESVASKETYQTYYSQANSLVSSCDGQIASFEKVTTEENLPVIPANRVREGQKTISKYSNTSEVVRWVFEHKKGEVSPIITVDNKVFFVVAIKDIREDGYTPVDQVASSIRFQLTTEKRLEKLNKEIAEKIASCTNIEEVATALSQKVQSKEGLSFGAMVNPSIDPAVVGAVSVAEQGKITGPVNGQSSVYVFVVKNRTEDGFYSDDDVKLRAQQVAGYAANSLNQEFNKLAKTVDRRAKFF